ncbi:MAG: NAD(P)/FAD-dependent oxidoreductase, partial [Candidatus Heimdallarchaeota archaeon]|nr:NAD(P)/FAD-dependent oxidoreductase [Candidatus Heimdallarchaeota archaeon]
MKEIGVAIVGGGPAGLQAAITLANKGIKPILFEEHSTIGEPIQCGEGLSVHAFKDFNLPKGEKSFCVKELDACHIIFPENKTILGDIQATMIRRDKFDQFLSKKATNLGAEIFTATKVTDVQRKTDGVVIKTKSESNSQYFAKLLILAEGPNAQLAKTLCFQTPSP